MKIADLTNNYDTSRLEKSQKSLARYGDDFYRTQLNLELLIKLMREQPGSEKITTLINNLPWKAKTYILKNIVKTMPDGTPNSAYKPASLEKPSNDKIKLPVIKP